MVSYVYIVPGPAYGELWVAGGSGALILDNGTFFVQIYGTIAQVNMELDGLTYVPPPDWSSGGPFPLELTIMSFSPTWFFKAEMTSYPFNGTTLPF